MREELVQAKQLLEQDGYTCVMKKGNLIFVSKERGITPLLQWLETGMDFNGAVAADKVVGKAAAYLYVLLRVVEVYAWVISRPALDVLQQYGVTVKYENLVPGIRNRAGDGFCPMETAVLQVDDPQEAHQILKQKRAELLQQAQN